MLHGFLQEDQSVHHTGVWAGAESKDPVELPAGTYKDSVVALPLKEAGIPAEAEKTPTTAVV